MAVIGSQLVASSRSQALEKSTIAYLQIGLEVLGSCLQVCTTWNNQVSSVPKFMDKVYAHQRKCKENAENHHASQKQMEVIVFPTQRQSLATFTPNSLTQIQTKETCSTTVSFKCIKPVWHKSGCSERVSPSKRLRQSEDICGTKKSKKRLHRL